MTSRYSLGVSALTLTAGLGMVAATAGIVASRLAPRGVVAAALTAYLVAWAEVVTVTLALSLVDGLERWSLLAALVIVVAGALALTRVVPRGDPILHPSASALRSALRDPVVALLALAVALALGYGVALGVFTPPNDWDAMTYHLARAAFWIQQDAVAYVPGAQIVRIDVNPPNAEIGSAFTMLLSGGDRFVWLGQLTALLALMAGVVGIARRVGLGRGAALFGALLFATLPVVVLQGSSALNDLVVASFLLAATFFLLGETRRELAFGALALALALGTKFTAVISLPLVALVVLAGLPRARRPAALIAGLAGALVGSYWLVVNLVETGSVDGGAGTELDQHPDRSPADVLGRATRFLVNFADDLNLEQDVWVYVVVAVVLACVTLASERDARRRPLLPLIVVAVGCLPVLTTSAREALLRAHEKLWLTLGRSDLAFLGESRESWSPSTVLSHYGPPGLVLLVLGTGFVAYETRRRRLRPLALLLALAPVLLAVLLALVLVYDPWRGRFFMVAVALAAPTWGVLLRRRAIAWGVASIAIATLGLAFVHSLEKPVGVALFDESTAAGVWGEPRETVQTWIRPDGTAELIRYFSTQPETGLVGVRLDEDDWVYPYFGSSLSRDVAFVASEDELDDLDWLVVRPRDTLRPGSGWELALETRDGWSVYERDARAAW